MPPVLWIGNDLEAKRASHISWIIRRIGAVFALGMFAPTDRPGDGAAFCNSGDHEVQVRFHDPDIRPIENLFK